MFCMRIQLRKDRDLVRQLDKLTELINRYFGSDSRKYLLKFQKWPHS